MGDPMPFLVGLVSAAVLTPLAGGVGRALGLVDRPGELKIHRRPVPLTGGWAIVAAVAVAALVGGSWPPWGAAASALVALAVGTVDDRSPVSPVLRVAALLVVGGLLVAGTAGVRDAGLLAWIGAMVLVLVAANAVNITDGQDGLVAGLGAVAALGLALLLGDQGPRWAFLLGLATAGALGGFLLWNRPPARVFLGNGGAYALGTVFAVLVLEAVAAGGWLGFLAAGACLGPFAFEVAFTVTRRLRARGCLAAGDRLHSYDLVARTAGRTASTVVFVLLGVLSSGVGLLIRYLPVVGLPLAVVGAVLAASWGTLLWRRRVPT